VPVFLRWLLVDVIVIRLLRRRRRRRYLDRSLAVPQQRYGRAAEHLNGPPAGDYRYARRRRSSCCAGCLVLIAAMTLGVVLLGMLVHWAL
jgi:hypothetical protein